MAEIQLFRTTGVHPYFTKRRYLSKYLILPEIPHETDFGFSEVSEHGVLLEKACRVVRCRMRDLLLVYPSKMNRSCPAQHSDISRGFTPTAVISNILLDLIYDSRV